VNSVKMLAAKREVPKTKRCAEDGSAIGFGFAIDSEVDGTEAGVGGIGIPGAIGGVAGIVSPADGW
jgi:hypothetical protein